MAELARKPRYTFAEYLAIDETSVDKHEYVQGEIFAMDGGTVRHAQLSANVIGLLTAQLRGRPCIVLTSDARVRVRATGLATYPDVSVVCGAIEQDPDSPHTVIDPVVLIEVLSDTTESYDREEKFAHYRRIPSLREYLLVSQREHRIELLSRNDNETWTLLDVGRGQIARLSSIDCTLAVDEIYRDPFDAGAPVPE